MAKIKSVKEKVVPKRFADKDIARAFLKGLHPRMLQNVANSVKA